MTKEIDTGARVGAAGQHELLELLESVREVLRMHPRSSPLGMTIALSRLERAATVPLRDGGTALDAWIAAARDVAHAELAPQIAWLMQLDDGGRFVRLVGQKIADYYARSEKLGAALDTGLAVARERGEIVRWLRSADPDNPIAGDAHVAETIADELEAAVDVAWRAAHPRGGL